MLRLKVIDTSYQTCNSPFIRSLFINLHDSHLPSGNFKGKGPNKLIDSLKPANLLHAIMNALWSCLIDFVLPFFFFNFFFLNNEGIHFSCCYPFFILQRGEEEHFIKQFWSPTQFCTHPKCFGFCTTPLSYTKHTVFFIYKFNGKKSKKRKESKIVSLSILHLHAMA